MLRFSRCGDAAPKTSTAEALLPKVGLLALRKLTRICSHPVWNHRLETSEKGLIWPFCAYGAVDKTSGE